MTLAQKVIAWQIAHGRHDLPWQGTRDPYAIWVSEIMLQQTQVATVVPYYHRFMARFPSSAALAAAALDDVLAHWSGLGYYSRARNLHRAAQVIRDEHSGEFPRTFDAVVALPGIGRSTAAAVMVFAHGARHAILDGNVKRVLARCCGIGGYPGEKRVADALWQAAEEALPTAGIEAYTQGLMDLGATVCLRRQPRCGACPLARTCAALREQAIDTVPAPRPRKALPHKNTVMVILEHAGALLLEKRPAAGIWGGLWCFPELSAGENVSAVCAQRFSADIADVEALPEIQHGFTHFRLTIAPQRLRVSALVPRVMEPGHVWMTLADAKAAAIPAPVRRILESLESASAERSARSSG
ncbi:MAG TPA: A/G-specific adenine glycosylase [Burkholderiales bacterium]|nr:A/G-specific adenine glycosylase [Burkholderiales bacterium]